MFDFLRNISPTEWIVVGLIVVILFGGKIAKMLGRTSGETFREIKNIKKSFSEALDEKEDEKK